MLPCKQLTHNTKSYKMKDAVLFVTRYSDGHVDGDIVVTDERGNDIPICLTKEQVDRLMSSGAISRAVRGKVE